MIKAPRLLPVVIAAATALLLFKGIGLVTNGGYVLVGTTSSQAQEGEAKGEAAGGAEPVMAFPEEATMSDSSPTMEDKSPVLALEEKAAAGEGKAESSAEGEAAAEGKAAAEGETAAEGEAPAEGEATAEKAGAGDGEALQAACPPEAPTMEEPGTAKSEIPADAAAMAPKPNCIPVPVNEFGDAIPLELNAEGKLAPVVAEAGSAADLASRLGERRADLDAREKELEMRVALVEAAEKRIEERTAVLKALEAQIGAMVEEKKTDEKEQFAGIVAMYETMKPKEAATIFNTLDNDILLRVARAMSPRKMAPILARMEPLKAKTLTAGLARQEAEPTVAPGTVEDLASLPQIVGQ